MEKMDYEKMMTKGALRSIKYNERVEDAVMQVIGVIEKCLPISIPNNFYNINVSDGENISSVGLTADLKRMLSTGELTKFSLIKINNYMSINILESTKEPRQVIIISDLVVIVPGYIICKIIGNPQPIGNNIELIVRTEASAATVQINEEYNDLLTKQALWKSLIDGGQYSRLLTIGALQSILDSVEVKYPVMQVLNIGQVMNTVPGNNGYRLTISDGQHYYPLVVLGSPLTNMITYGYLTASSIIYIRSYGVSNEKNRFGRKQQFIILMDLVCLVIRPGAIIGNPKPIKDNSGQVVRNSIPASTDAIEMDNLAPPTVQDPEMDNLQFNLDMLNIF